MPRFTPPAAASLAALTDVDLSAGDGLANLRTLKYDEDAQEWTPRQTFGGAEERLVSGTWETTPLFFTVSRGTKHVPHSPGATKLYRVNGHSSGGSSTSFHVDGVDLATGAQIAAVSAGGGSGGAHMACVIGGYPYAVAASTPYHLWRFNPAAGTWADLGAKPTSYGTDDVSVAGLLGEGVIMGRDYVSRFNPILSGFGALANPTVNDADWDDPVLVEANGYLYAIGGTDLGVATDRMLRYDRLTNTWATMAPLPSARRFGSAVEHHGILYYFGGLDSAGAATNTVYAYFPEANEWITVATVTPTTTGHATFGGGGAAVSYGNKIVIAGAAAGSSQALWTLT